MQQHHGLSDIVGDLPGLMPGRESELPMYPFTEAIEMKNRIEKRAFSIRVMKNTWTIHQFRSTHKHTTKYIALIINHKYTEGDHDESATENSANEC